MDNYVYELEGKLYLNLTNRCCNDCSFCIRNDREGLEGRGLWLSREPSFADMAQSLAKWDLSKYAEAVFCGFGEPVYNLDTLIQTAAHLKGLGKKVRLNTNGLGNLIHARDITPDLKGVLDTVSISLNASNAAAYQEKCRSVYGDDALPAVLEFARLIKAHVPEVVMSVVDEGNAQEVQRCRDICKALGVGFRLRTLYAEGEGTP